MAIAAVFFGPGLLAVVWQWVLDHRLWLLSGLLAVGGVATTVWRVREAERRAQFAALRRVEVTDTMTGTEFEHHIAELLRFSGFSAVTVHGGAGDRGRDISAIDPGGRRVVVQCKRYAKPVGAPDVQKFNGTAWTVHRAQVAMIVTNSTFTVPAQVESSEHGTLLVDRMALGRWLELDRPPYDIGRRSQPDSLDPA